VVAAKSSATAAAAAAATAAAAAAADRVAAAAGPRAEPAPGGLPQSYLPRWSRVRLPSCHPRSSVVGCCVPTYMEAALRPISSTAQPLELSTVGSDVWLFNLSLAAVRVGTHGRVRAGAAVGGKVAWAACCMRGACPNARQRTAGHAPAVHRWACAGGALGSMGAAVGGVMAYQKKGSRASLLASGGIAAALLLGAALMAGGTRVPGTLLSLGAPADRAHMLFWSGHIRMVAVQWLGPDVAAVTSGLSCALLAMCCAAQQLLWPCHEVCASMACPPQARLMTRLWQCMHSAVRAAHTVLTCALCGAQRQRRRWACTWRRAMRPRTRPSRS